MPKPPTQYIPPAPANQVTAPTKAHKVTNLPPRKGAKVVRLPQSPKKSKS